MDEGHDELLRLMQEPPGGENFGSTAPVITTAADGYGANDRPQPLNFHEAQSREFLVAGGWGIERTSAHRGVLHQSEYVDRDHLQALVEEGLGFTLAQVAEAYASGRPSAKRLLLRDKIDARLLELSDKGGNMTALARVFGWSIQDDGECRAMAGALRRARAAA